MPNALIHYFNPQGPPSFDDEGDEMMDFYYQLIDLNDDPITGMRGPYRYAVDAERAAQQAVSKGDF